MVAGQGRFGAQRWCARPRLGRIEVVWAHARATLTDRRQFTSGDQGGARDSPVYLLQFFGWKILNWHAPPFPGGL
eukprot:7993138-Pyramimonas_sp.AAC.1